MSIAMNATIILDIVGLPSEVLILIFSHLDLEEVLLTGLSSVRLLHWLDSNEAFWISQCLQYGLPLTPMGTGQQQLSVKQRVVARRRFESPFAGHIRRIPFTGPDSNLSMHNGTPFAVVEVTTTDERDLADFIDLSQWPLVETIKVPSMTVDNTTTQLLGHKVIRLKQVGFFKGSRNPGGSVFSLPSKQHPHLELIRDFAPPAMNLPGRWYCFPTENAFNPSCAERIAYYYAPHKEGENAFFFVYDAKSDVWAAPIQAPGSQYFNIVFDGTNLVLVMNQLIYAYHVAESTMATKTLLNGVALPQAECSNILDFAITNDYLLIVHRSESFGLTLRLSKAQLIEHRQTLIWERIILPDLKAEQFHDLVTFGPLSVLFFDNSAVVIDIVQNRAIRLLECTNNINAVRFIDSSLIAILERNSMIVVDMLSRSQPAPAPTGPHLQLFCLNSKTMQISQHFLIDQDLAEYMACTFRPPDMLLKGCLWFGPAPFDDAKIFYLQPAQKMNTEEERKQQLFDCLNEIQHLFHRRTASQQILDPLPYVRFGSPCFQNVPLWVQRSLSRAVKPLDFDVVCFASAPIFPDEFENPRISLQEAHQAVPGVLKEIQAHTMPQHG